MYISSQHLAINYANDLYNVTETATIRFFAHKCFHVKYISRQNVCLLVYNNRVCFAAHKVTKFFF